MITNILIIVLIVLHAVSFRESLLVLVRGEKKQHFYSKLKQARGQAWEMEFKKFQTMELMELIRLDRDKAKEAADACRVESEREHKPETKAELLQKKTIAEDNAERYEKQIVMLQNEVNGVAYNPGDPEKGIEPNPGQQGLNDTIAAIGEITKMFVLYLKTL